LNEVRKVGNGEPKQSEILFVKLVVARTLDSAKHVVANAKSVLLVKVAVIHWYESYVSDTAVYIHIR